jgi:membrane protease YdiL (CAAX protease family)
VGVFAIIGWLGMRVFAILMLPVGGLLVASTLSAFAAGALANVAASRLFGSGQLADFGMDWREVSGKDLLAGWVLGAGAAVAVVGIPLFFRLADFESTPEKIPHHWIALGLVSVALLFGAAGEEMLFHGYAFQLLTRSMGAFATILPVGVIFGLAHLGNENPSVAGLANTVLWGVLLGYATWRSRGLWVAIGMHFGWNLVLPLFGVNLSGFTIGLTGYTLHWSVGKLWSGGAYGPEGSALTTLAVIGLFWVVARKRGSDAEDR